MAIYGRPNCLKNIALHLKQFAKVGTKEEVKIKKIQLLWFYDLQLNYSDRRKIAALRRHVQLLHNTCYC